MLNRIISFAFVLFGSFLIYGCNKQDAASGQTPDQSSDQTTESFSEPMENPLPLPNGKLLTIAHRGVPAYAPEHTIPSYELAKEFGADFVELDLQMTKDGVLVSFHDADLSRIAMTDAKVGSLHFAEIQKLDASRHFQKADPNDQEFLNVTIPSLEEVLHHFGDTVNYYIETKYPAENPGMEEELLRLLKKYKLVNKTDENGLPKVIIQSFSEDSLKKVQTLAPAVPLIRLYNQKDFANISEGDIEQLTSYASGVGLPYQAVTKEDIERLHQHKLSVHLYTINDKEEMEKYIKYGADGIFTDYIDRLLDLVKK